MQEITQSYRRPETPSPEIWGLAQRWLLVSHAKPLICSQRATATTWSFGALAFYTVKIIPYIP
jgi:hypothetical protein